MGDAAKRLGWDDYLAFPDDGVRRQILDGEVEVSPAPTYRHQDLVAELAFSLRSHCRQEGIGVVQFAPLAVRLSGETVVEPDILFLKTGGAATLQDGVVVGLPDLVVEVLSPSNRRTDLIKKRRLYEAAGVTEYWIVDPEAESVTRLVLEGDRYDPQGPVFADAGLTVETPLIPGFALDVAALFASLADPK